MRSGGSEGVTVRAPGYSGGARAVVSGVHSGYSPEAFEIADTSFRSVHSTTMPITRAAYAAAGIEEKTMDEAFRMVAVVASIPLLRATLQDLI